MAENGKKKSNTKFKGVIRSQREIREKEKLDKTLHRQPQGNIAVQTETYKL